VTVRARSLLVALALAGSMACSGSGSDAPSIEPSPRRTRGRRPPAPGTLPLSEGPPLPPSSYPAPARLVAIGDVHGDVSAFRSVLRLGGAIDEGGHWTGGELVVVQNGDLLDRGDDEPEILALVSQLETEAAAAGGRFLALNGNHELMNAQLDFRYVTREGFTDFDRFRDEASREARAELPRPMHGRAGAFEPRALHARAFAARNTVVIVGDTVFVHGGLTPRYAAAGLDAINQAARAFFLGEGPLSSILQSEDSPIWYRGYSGEESPEVCAELEDALTRVHASRMVVGHTVQEGGIGSACEDRVWRIDVGLARVYDGPIEALEIAGDTVRVLRGRR